MKQKDLESLFEEEGKEDDSDEAGRLPVLPRVSFAPLQRTYNMEERGLMLTGDACNNAAQRTTFNDSFGFGHGDSSSVKRSGRST